MSYDSLSAEGLIAEAKRHLDLADERQRTADEDKWAAAECMWRAHREHGVTQTEIAGRIGRRQDTVSRHIKIWADYGARHNRPSFTEAYYEVRGPSGDRQSIADREVRKAVRERPEVVAEAISEASPETRQIVAEAALRPARDEGEDRRERERAVREEHSEDPSATHKRIVKLDLARADDAISKAILTAGEAGWPEDDTQDLVRRIEITEKLLGVLRLAVSNEQNVDWDAELERLIEGAAQ
jgi:hypothetical protein